MTRHLMLRLATPLLAFGGETIDNRGVVRSFPALSMLTGLLANALGWRRDQHELHDNLQQRLRVGTALEPGAVRITDFQTAQLHRNDVGWTTWGQPEGRAGGAQAYASPHLRWRDYHANCVAWVAITLTEPEQAPTLPALQAALDRPARPLFIGRKPCLPSARLVAGWQDAEHVLGALQAWVRQLPTNPSGWHAQWPDGQGVLPGDDRELDICDERNWRSGLHGGWRPVREGVLKGTEAT